jgi:hypothetical protein
MKLYEPQPSILIYPFDGGWKVISYIWNNLFSRTQSAANFWYKQGEDWQDKARYEENDLLKYWYSMAFVGFQLAGICQFISALFLVAVFFLCQVIFLALWAFLASILMVILSIGNSLYSNVYKIFFRCPDCHEQMPVPIYICPKCATQHSRLWPSVYGVFYHRCEKCDAKLPALDVLGRKNIIQRCANSSCNAPMNKEVGRLVNVHIPVIGGASVGKSNYIFMAINQFIDGFANPRKYLVEFPDENHHMQYQSNLKLLSSGQVLIKTSDMLPHAYNITVKKQSKKMGKIVYIYDAAGEVYQDENEAMRQLYIKYVHGLIFMIDPFSINYFSKKHEGEIEAIKTAIRPGSNDVAIGSYERMLAILEASASSRHNHGTKLRQPLAVVVSKADGLDLESEIGLSAAQELLKNKPEIKIIEDAIDLLVRRFLEDNGLGNLIRNIDNQFENVKYFSSSALGRLPDEGNKQPYQPMRVLEPFLWLLSHLDVVKLSDVRIKKIDTIDKGRAQTMGNVLKGAKYYYWDSLKPRSRQ